MLGTAANSPLEYDEVAQDPFYIQVPKVTRTLNTHNFTMPIDSVKGDGNATEWSYGVNRKALLIGGDSVCLSASACVTFARSLSCSTSAHEGHPSSDSDHGSSFTPRMGCDDVRSPTAATRHLIKHNTAKPTTPPPRKKSVPDQYAECNVTTTRLMPPSSCSRKNNTAPSSMTGPQCSPSRVEVLKRRLGIDSSLSGSFFSELFQQRSDQSETSRRRQKTKSSSLFPRSTPIRMVCLMTLLTLTIVSLGLTRAYIQAESFVEGGFSSPFSPSLAFKATHPLVFPQLPSGTTDSKKSEHTGQGVKDALQRLVRVNSKGLPVWGYVATVVVLSIAYEVFGLGHNIRPRCNILP